MERTTRWCPSRWANESRRSYRAESSFRSRAAITTISSTMTVASSRRLHGLRAAQRFILTRLVRAAKQRGSRRAAHRFALFGEPAEKPLHRLFLRRGHEFEVAAAVDDLPEVLGLDSLELEPNGAHPFRRLVCHVLEDAPCF